MFKNINPLFIFPPGWTPVGPYLALPILKSYLREKFDINADIVDLNVEFYEYILSYKFLKKCIFKIEDDLNNLDQIDITTYNLAKNSANLIEEAKCIIRSDDYFNLEKRAYAENILRNCFFLINLSYNKKLIFDFNSIKMEYSYKKSSDVKEVLNNPPKVFIDFFMQYIEKIKLENRQFIAISISGSYQFIPALILAKLLRENCPNIKHISLGGNYITRIAKYRLPDKSNLYKWFDSIMLYDGEASLPHLINNFNETPSDLMIQVPNLYLIKDRRLLKQDIQTKSIINDTIPDFDGFSLDKYFMPKIVLPLYTSRQCFNKCAFCTIPKATDGNYRVIPIEKVLKSMMSLSKKYDTNIFSFVDETFTASRMKELAELILKNKFKCYWHGETRFSSVLDDATCKVLYESGCRQIQFGLESYNQRVLNKMRKNIKIDWIDENLHACLRNGIPVHMFFMIGFPTETKEEALNSLNYTSKILKESVLKYKNPYSSRGFQEFGLDIGSDVWCNPEKYYISKVFQNSRGDLSTNVDFCITKGLSTSESIDLVEKSKYEHQSEKLFNEYSILPNRLHVSEITWILDSVEGTDYNKGNKKAIRQLDFDNIKSILWGENISKSFVHFQKNKDYQVLYNLNNHYTYFAPSDFYKELSNWIDNDHYLYKFSNKKILHNLEILEYFGFIHIIKKRPVDFCDETKLLLNPNYVIKDSLDEKKYIFNTITHEMAKVSKNTNSILPFFESIISYNDLEMKLLKSGINEQLIKNFRDFVNVLIKINVLIGYHERR